MANLVVLLTTDPVGTTIRFFLSSTFADFQTERNVLQRRVFPELRRLCATSGFRLQPIDLRWGVSEAAGTDRQTLRICFDELERCRTLSPDFFLLIQLGNRYGSHILPPQVPSALIARLLPRLSAEERRAFEAAYRLDENAMPPEYVLLRAEGPEREEDERLRQALVRSGHAAEVSAEDLLPFTGSATHREIQLGLLGQPLDSPAASGVLCAQRSFAGEPRGAEADRFVERDPGRIGHVQQLAAAVLDRLPAEQVLRYTVAWEGERGPAFDEDALAQAYVGLLQPKLEAVIAVRTAARRALAAQGRDEIALANAAFEHERAARVEGREAELARLAAYLAGETGVGLPLVVTGAAGSGKSTLLAETAIRATAAQPNAALIARYIGVTPGAESFSTFLNDLRRAIAQAHGQAQPEALGEIGDENQLVGALAAQLATVQAPPERPLLLVLDALDQLGANTQRTDWLPPRLAPHVRVVVSLLSDRAELGFLRKRLPAEQILTVTPLSREAGRAMLRDLLAEAPQRRLSPSQEEAVLGAFAPEGLPLYLRLLASEAHHWCSFDPPRLETRGTTKTPTPLPATTPDLLQTILERLEAPERNGRALVARSLGDLAAARFGLAEDELLDLLSRDAAVREAQQALSPTSPPIDPDLPLPVALWARLHAQIAPLLAEREAEDGVRLTTFYHQQLRAAVQARYLAGAERVERHQALAAYFAGLPWRLGPQQWNWRKVRELVTQQEHANEQVAAYQTLGDLVNTLEHLLSERADITGIFEVVKAVEEFLTTPTNAPVGERIYGLQLEAAQKLGNRTVEAKSFNHVGKLVARTNGLGWPERAQGYLERALEIAHEVGDRAVEGEVLLSLGGLATRLAQRERAQHYYEQALEIAREVGDRTVQGATLLSLGRLATIWGQREASRGYYERALEIAHEVGDRTVEQEALVCLGDLAPAEEARTFYERALEIAREVGNHDGESNTLNHLGDLAIELGRSEAARRYYEQALAILREGNNRFAIKHTLNNLGALALDVGQVKEARAYYEGAIEIARAVGDYDWDGATTNLRGLRALDLGQSDEVGGYYFEAHETHAMSLVIAQREGDSLEEGKALYKLGALAARLGPAKEARAYYEEALPIFEEIGATEHAQVVRAALSALSAARSRRRRWWPFRRHRR